MDDLISRQAVIGVIDTAEKIYVNNLPPMVYAHTLEQAIMTIPIQAEIVQCKDCKYYRKDHGWNCIEYTVCAISPIHKVIRKPDDYCSMAERRTDE